MVDHLLYVDGVAWASPVIRGAWGVPAAAIVADLVARGAPLTRL